MKPYDPRVYIENYVPWKLWLDDQHDDPETPMRHVPEGFVGAKTSEEALTLMRERGIPTFMDLDHDLGGDDTVMHMLRRMPPMFPDGPVPEYRLHTQNPVGAKSVEAFLHSWAKSLKLPDKRYHGIVSDHEVLSFLHSSPIAAVFSISTKEWEKLEAFRDKHHKIHKGRDGAIGGRFTYSFTPTTLFCVVRCECACGASVDATNYEDV